MNSIEEALADYILVLDTSYSNCHQAEDRPSYTSHLAAAAVMFASYTKTKSITELKKLVAEERRAYGVSFLAHDEGKKAESAFHKFAVMIESAKS
jgi:hypothetical protein